MELTECGGVQANTRSIGVLTTLSSRLCREVIGWRPWHQCEHACDLGDRDPLSCAYLAATEFLLVPVELYNPVAFFSNAFRLDEVFSERDVGDHIAECALSPGSRWFGSGYILYDGAIIPELVV